MAERPTILIVPGANEQVRGVARALGNRSGVVVLETANAMLWQLRRIGAAIVLADTELADIGGNDLVDIVPAVNARARLILCGAGTGELKRNAQVAGVKFFPPGPMLDAGLQQFVRVLTQGTYAVEPHAEAQVSPVPVAQAAATPTDTIGVSPATQVIQPFQASTIEQVLTTLVTDAQACAVVLNNLAGMELGRAGVVPERMTAWLAPLLATLVATADEVARQMEEVPGSQAVYIHAGSRYHLYVFKAGPQTFLAVVVDKAFGDTSRRTVFRAVERAVADLARMVKL